jgi:GntR family transcriptional regulator
VIAAALGIEPGSPTLYLERLRVAGGEPLLLEQVHLPAERFPGLLASDLEHGSLYDLLTARYGTRIVRAREALEPVLLRAREARLLGQKARTPALLIEGTAFGADGSPVEFARSYVRGDRTRYYVERVVVRASWQTDPDATHDPGDRQTISAPQTSGSPPAAETGTPARPARSTRRRGAASPTPVTQRTPTTTPRTG